MSDAETNVTPLPPVEIVPTHPAPVAAPVQAAAVPVPSDDLRPSITGARRFGSSIADLIAAIKGEVDASFEDIQSAAKDLRAGINNAKTISKALRSEASDLKSQLGQISNFPPEGEQ